MDVRQKIVEDGFCLLPSAVSRDVVDAALGRINRAFTTYGIRPEDNQRHYDLTYFPEITSAPEIKALYGRTQLHHLAEQLISERAQATGTQIALRFPEDQARALQPHVDGTFHRHTGGRGYIHHFTALAGVFLSEAGPGDGTLYVWPGSHLALAAHFARNGADRIIRFGELPEIDFGPPVPLHVRPGDAFIAHNLLVHSISSNIGPNIRYAVFFRVKHPHVERFNYRPLIEPWLGWNGINNPASTTSTDP